MNQQREHKQEREERNQRALRVEDHPDMRCIRWSPFTWWWPQRRAPLRVCGGRIAVRAWNPRAPLPCSKVRHSRYDNECDEASHEHAMKATCFVFAKAAHSASLSHVIPPGISLLVNLHQRVAPSARRLKTGADAIRSDATRCPRVLPLRIALHRTAPANFACMSITPNWNSLRERWPNAESSKFVDAAGLRWHVQLAGTGPAIVLLHGSGAATYTWRDVLPQLAKLLHGVRDRICRATDSQRVPMQTGLSLTGNGPRRLRELLRVLDITPRALVGHSAGGAIALWLANEWPEASVVGINAALAPPNVLMSLLTPGVDLLSRSGLTGFLTAKLAESDFVFDSLMRSTGSVIRAEQLALYRTFATSSEHAGAVMSMFSNWDLTALARKLPSINNRVTLIVGLRDEWVPAADTRAVAALLPNATFIEILNAGHLAHEELPALVSGFIENAAK